jgi:ADP-ribose pyrophosphatase YjhB (NUDIX family)
MFRFPQNPALHVDPFPIHGKGGVQCVLGYNAWGEPIVGDFNPLNPFNFNPSFGAHQQVAARPALSAPSGRVMSIEELEAVEAKYEQEQQKAKDTAPKIVMDYVDPFTPCAPPAVEKPVVKPDVRARAAPPPPPAPVDHSTTALPPAPRGSEPLCRGCYNCDRGAGGGGCLIIVHRKGKWYILLGLSKGKYTDLGGLYESGERIHETAAREVDEESAYTIRMRIPIGTPYVDAVPPHGSKHFYRCYIIRNDAVSCSAFKRAIGGRALPKACQEMDKLTLFPISELNPALLARNKAVTKKGKTVRLSDRAVNVITMARDNHLL